MKKLPAILKNKQQEDSSLCSERQEKERSEGQEERPDKRRNRMTGEEAHGRREKKTGEPGRKIKWGAQGGQKAGAAGNKNPRLCLYSPDFLQDIV
ncbi:MAG: hypothetical protein HP001_09475 [Oscillospiraceae bacterium]|nr:hypothetical protein [Oscillospiraceae bacterium]